MQGLEFVVAYDPLQAAAQSETSFAHEPSNVWVIRKQTRRKRGGLDDEVVVLATFFVVGDCIYMAPSVASVVGNRLVGCQIDRKSTRLNSSPCIVRSRASKASRVSTKWRKVSL